MTKKIFVYFAPRFYRMFIADCFINGHKKATHLRNIILSYYDKSK